MADVADAVPLRRVRRAFLRALGGLSAARRLKRARGAAVEGLPLTE